MVKEMAEKNSFVVYTDIAETLEELEDAQVAALFRGMVKYQQTGEDPKFRGTLKYVFIPIRQQMDRDNEKWSKTKEARSLDEFFQQQVDDAVTCQIHIHDIAGAV